MFERLLQPVTKILDKLVVNKDLKVQLQHELKTAIHSANLAQIEVNKTEAAHASVFVSGWRPCCGWVCGISLAYHFILAPLLQFSFALAGYEQDLPNFDFSQLSTILMGLLGLGGLRTWEKMNGVARDS